MASVDVRQMNSLTLAYIGDAVYELHVRNYLIHSGHIKPNQLHQEAITFVSGKSQANVVQHWLKTDYLTEAEERVVKRGRNAKSHSAPRNINIQTYRYSTGFESLIGYHYLLKNNDRLETLLTNAIAYTLKAK